MAPQTIIEPHHVEKWGLGRLKVPLMFLVTHVKPPIAVEQIKFRFVRKMDFPPIFVCLIDMFSCKNNTFF